MDKIPFYIISGFLGSGKTTLLKRIIDHYAGDRRTGIIQNEYAPVGIDSVELKETGKNFHLLEVNNGSVFCVCLLGDFVQSLSDFIDQNKPEILFMEASGLSDTTSVSEVLNSPLLERKIFLAGNWCVVDALNFGRSGAMQQRLTHQVRMADRVLINKTDLAGDAISTVKDAIRKINPFTGIHETVFCDSGWELIPGSLPKFYFDHAEPLDRPEVRSMVIKTTQKISESSLLKFLECWAGKAYRIKGYVNLTGGDTVAVQCVYDSIRIQKVEFIHGPTELIALTHQFSLREWNGSFREFCSLKQ